MLKSNPQCFKCENGKISVSLFMTLLLPVDVICNMKMTFQYYQFSVTLQSSLLFYYCPNDCSVKSEHRYCFGTVKTIQESVLR
jgi:hypothetical protein